LIFAAALFVAAASPGPATIALVARGLARGTSGAFAFMLGIAIGDVFWLCAAVLGLAVLAQTFGMVFLALKYAGAAYLLFLAWRLWTSPTGPDAAKLPETDKSLRLFAAGLILMLGNPKVMVFYLALLPNLIDLGAITPVGFAELIVVTLVVVLCVDGTYVLTAARARLLFKSARALRWMNRCSGAMMAGAAAAVAAR
jgi:threonine/homoserine/homoserine lactone efflux protein